MPDSSQSLSIRGFTLVELLVVVAIVSFLSAVTVSTVQEVRENARFNTALQELRSFHQATQLYRQEHGEWPGDVVRNVPPGLEEYLGPGNWPKGPWPGSVYDWDNWVVDDKHIYQVSIRFCEFNKPDTCRFPNQDWAEDFDTHSAVYYCLKGPCRAHSSKPPDHPGLCVNC